jgi:hypothetical protein
MNNNDLLKEYKEKILQSISIQDKENSHIYADAVLCDLLIELGFEEIVKIYKSSDKWYA